MLANERRDAGHDAVEFLGRRSGAGSDRTEAFGGEREMTAQQRPIERLFTAEVVIEHGLVDASAAGDTVDAGAGESARGELDGGGGENAVGGHACAAGHRSKLTS